MPVDASIYSQIRQPAPVNLLAMAGQAQHLQGMQQQNRLAELAFQDRGRAQADAARLSEVTRGFGPNPSDNVNKLFSAGFLNQGLDYQKQAAEVGKTRAETAVKGVEAGSKAFDYFRSMLGTVQDPQQAAELITAAYRDTTLGPLLQSYGTLEHGLQRLQQYTSSPQAFAQWKANAAIGMEKLAEMAKVQNVNTGGQTVTQAVQPATGQVTQLGVMQNTISPDAQLSANTSRANNTATVGATLQGQKLADDRARDFNVISQQNRATKPMPATAVKLQNEDLEAIGTFRGLDSDLAALEQQLTDGKLKLGLATNAAGSALNAVGMSTENSRNLASFKAKLENMRNESLRLNKGVQTEGDSVRAWNEAMANINDDKIVKQRLAEIRALNSRAADLRKNNVDLLRSNYGAEPLDYSRYDKQPATLNLPKPGAPAKTKSGATASNW